MTMGQDTIADRTVARDKHLFYPLPQGLGSQEYTATLYPASNPLLWSPSHCYLHVPSELSLWLAAAHSLLPHPTLHPLRKGVVRANLSLADPVLPAAPNSLWVKVFPSHRWKHQGLVESLQFSEGFLLAEWLAAGPRSSLWHTVLLTPVAKDGMGEEGGSLKAG